MEDKFTGTMAVREQHRFDSTRLQRFMESHVEGFSGSLEVEQFRGGQSCPTYKLTAGGRSYVLRRKPPGKLLPSAHAVDREYRVISALHDTPVPVARSYALSDDEEIVGTAFYIMEWVDGRVFWEPTLPGLSKAERGAVYDAMNEALAALHKVADHLHSAGRFPERRHTGRAGVIPLEADGLEALAIDGQLKDIGAVVAADHVVELLGLDAEGQIDLRIQYAL